MVPPRLSWLAGRRLVLLAVAVGIMSGLLGCAQSAQAVTVSPIRLELAVDPGGAVASRFKVFNEQAQPRTYYISVARFETNDETGEPVFVPGRQGLPSWVTAPGSIVAPAREFLEVPFSINPPAGVDPGGYFAAIFVSPVPPEQQDGNNIALRSDVGTLILLRVNGDFSEGETILKFGTKDEQYWFSSLPIEFYYRFQNSGADRAKPLGDITIKNIFGRVTKLISANRSAGNTLPQSIRRYESAWTSSRGNKVENDLGPVRYLPDNASWLQTLSWQWEHFALGRYAASLRLTVNNDSSRSYAAHTSFWIIPWQLLLTIGAALAVLLIAATALALLVIWLVLRNRRKQ